MGNQPRFVFELLAIKNKKTLRPGGPQGSTLLINEVCTNPKTRPW
jgi:hypothetical protein